MFVIIILFIVGLSQQAHGACTISDDLGLFLYSDAQCIDKEMSKLLSNLPTEQMQLAEDNKTITHIDLTICHYSCGINPNKNVKFSSFDDYLKLVEVNKTKWHAIQESVVNASDFCLEELKKVKTADPALVFSGVQCEPHKADLSVKDDFLSAKKVLAADQKILQVEKDDLKALTPSLLRAEYVTTILEDLSDNDNDLDID